ncbi:MAG TPA: ATP-binding cassette domain-containing protein [Pseudomonadales bacterium]|nr:ATP-binding cassette domain-containing protein [Pseudomonadales bacterium]
MTVVEARELAFHAGSRTLWSNLDIHLNAGERLAVAGPSGSGKTLLLRVLAGLEPVESGQILLEGRPLADWPMPEYRRRILYVQQKPAFREGTVQDAIEAPFRFRVHGGRTPPLDEIRIHLEALGRGDAFLAEKTEHLSGGELQIVAVLRALAIGPSVLLLDEPTASLDAEAVHGVEMLVGRWLEADSAHATVWTSHDVMQLERVSDSILTLGREP